jgi:hypothetical protein
LLRGQTNGHHDAFQILQYLVIGESEDAVPARGKPLIAPVVVANTLFEIVALAVDFNDELAGMCDEVRDVIAHRALAAKSERGQPMGFQMAPQQGFGARHRPS